MKYCILLTGLVWASDAFGQKMNWQDHCFNNPGSPVCKGHEYAVKAPPKEAAPKGVINNPNGPRPSGGNPAYGSPAYNSTGSPVMDAVSSAMNWSFADPSPDILTGINVKALADSHLARGLIVFLAANKGLSQVDVLGFSIGGYVAQALTLRHPSLVRRLVLVGTKPRAGDDTDRHPDVNTVGTRHDIPTLEDFQFLFFAPSPSSQAASETFWERRHQRTIDTDPPTSKQTMQAQVAAIVDWKQPHGEPFAELATITQPTLVVNGEYDNSLKGGKLTASLIPGAVHKILPKTGHACNIEDPATFDEFVIEFLRANNLMPKSPS